MNLSEHVMKLIANAASSVPLQAASVASLSAGVASDLSKPPAPNVTMADAVEIPSPEFLLNTVNLSVLDATISDNDFVDIRNDVHMVLEYEIQELLPPTPSIHNEIVGVFRNQEPGDLLGALASALERSESAHKANLASLTVIKGHRPD
jgi:hypothetical protein